jgi:tetratricopeptide (TPR) repeat protein
MSAKMLAAVLAAATGLAQAGVLGRADAASAPGTSDAIHIGAVPAPEDAAELATLNQASALINGRRPQAGIDLLDPLIATLEARWRDKPETLYCSHSDLETLAYMLDATLLNKPAIALDATFCDAYFMRGYAEVDLGRADAAQRDYARAIALAPRRAHYLSEMGELHSSGHDWPGAMGYYEQARDQATRMQPESEADSELGRALRGIAYVDVELGKLDEAEALYRRCLEIDPKDQKAQAELGYVLGQKQKQHG